MTCAIYCRLSREDADKTGESESIQNQRALLVEYADAMSWQVYRVYCDEDYSGADRDRPAFGAMLRDAREGRFGIILCKTQSRFTRDMELVERYIHGLFPQWGIRFVALVDGVDTQVKGNKKTRQINGLVNEWYLEDLSENIRTVLDQKRRSGQYIGSFALYGYQKVEGDKNRLEIDPPAAEVVRRIYAMYLEGGGKQQIAHQLNREGVPSPGRYRREALGPDMDDGNRVYWSKTAVDRILRNEMYTGVLVQGVRRKVSYKSPKLVSVPESQWIRVPGTHPPIISPETFAQAQHLLGHRRRSDGTGALHPLAGKVRCGDCGGAMIKTSSTYKGSRRSYLRCRRYALGKDLGLCTSHSIRLDTLEDLVLAGMRRALEAYYQPDYRGLARQISAKTGTPELQKELALLQTKLSGRAKALETLYLDRAEGIITPQQFAQFSADFQREKEALEQRIAGLRQQLAQGDGGSPDVEARIDAALRLPRLSHGLAEALVRKIEVGEKDGAQGVQSIKLYWNF